MFRAATTPDNVIVRLSFQQTRFEFNLITDHDVALFLALLGAQVCAMLQFYRAWLALHFGVGFGIFVGAGPNEHGLAIVIAVETVVFDEAARLGEALTIPRTHVFTLRLVDEVVRFDLARRLRSVLIVLDFGRVR